MVIVMAPDAPATPTSPGRQPHRRARWAGVRQPRRHPHHRRRRRQRGRPGDPRRLDVAGLPGVAETMRITVPYKLVSAQNHAQAHTVRVGGVPIGPDTFTLIAGPCAVETPEQTLEAAQMAKRAGATLLRGGAYKPRTSPYAFQGLGVEGLRILAEVRDEVGLPVVTEVHGRDRRRRRRRARRHAADRHPQHAELRAAAGGRRRRQAGDAQARADRDVRGVADGRRVHRPARQPRHRAVRARRALLRAGDPQHARRLGGRRWCSGSRTCR